MYIFNILNIFGALALLLYGMKVMSDAVQKVSVSSVKKILNPMTRSKYTAFLAGLFFTATIQSSTASSVLLLSFVNTGLISLLKAYCVIIGANIGSTSTLWLIVLFGLSLNILSICLPLLIVVLPFYFSNNLHKKNWASFVIGFVLIFIGLYFLEQNIPNLSENKIFLNYINHYKTNNYLFSIFFILAGFFITAIVHSSAASISLFVVLVTKGLPLELGAALIVGANIGTTMTAQVAALVGNTQVKKVAYFHTLFNFLGSIAIFFFIPIILTFLNDKIPNESIVLASFHTLFNVFTALLVFPFVNYLAQKSDLLFLDKEANKNKKIQSKTFSNTPEINLYSAKREVLKFASITKQTINYLGRLITESDEEKLDEITKRILTLENDGDKLEEDVFSFLRNTYTSEMSGETTKKIHNLMDVCHHLENVGDLAIKTAYIHKDRRKSSSYITPRLRTLLLEMQEALALCTTTLIQNLNENATEIDLKTAKSNENTINLLHNQSLETLYKTIENDRIKTLSAIYYKEILQNYELIGDHLYKANLALSE